MVTRNIPEVWREERALSPNRELRRMQRRMEHMLNDFFTSPFQNQLRPFTRDMMELEEAVFAPACDIEETDSQYLIQFDLPGIKKDDVKIEIRDNLLIVSGERKEEERTEKSNVLGMERYRGAFLRSFTLPTQVDADQVEASFENGVLRVVVPKVEATQSKLVQIKEAKVGKKAA